LALAASRRLGNFREALLTRREQFLVAGVLLAFLTGLAVKHWRATQNLKNLPTIGVTSP
jgi:hypothetical protein